MSLSGARQPPPTVGTGDKRSRTLRLVLNIRLSCALEQLE
jgi:hypothetical protein